MTLRPVIGCFAALSFALTLPSMGCVRSAEPAAAPPKAAVPPKAGTRTPTFESSVPHVSSAQDHAQHAWCSYLDALYHRATQDGTAWAQLERCQAEPSSAAPEMLERTAACSRRALEGFAGDPFTTAYAAEVKRCGTEAIEAMALTQAEVDPYVQILCERASSCNATTHTPDVQPASCHADASSRFGARIGRAVGVLNEESRAELRRCLQNAACQDMSDQLSGCLEPILERLLWTPG